jgi:hypothetical protein
MLKRRLKAPSPAFVVSLLALFVALGGTTYAATSFPANSVGTKQLKKNAVTAAKIKKGAIVASKVNPAGLTVPEAIHAKSADSATSAVHATSAASATNATNAINAASAQPVAFAHVSSSGVLDAADSKNVTGVTRLGPSGYCLTGIPFAVRGGQATTDENDSNYDFAQFALGDAGGNCPAGTKAWVVTLSAASIQEAAGFFVVLYG